MKAHGRKKWLWVAALVLAAALLGACAPAGGPDAAQGSVTLSILCGNATAGGVAGAPGSGVILAPVSEPLRSGDTVWTVTERVCRGHGIAAVKSGAGAQVFVKSIGGLAAQSGQSGWMFSVNGEFVMTGAGTAQLAGGDVLVWAYTMDSGNDLKQGGLEQP